MDRILVIDDDFVTLALVAAQLEAEGYGVDQASDPERAIEEYRVGFHSLVITDFHMPRMTGRELVERIKTIDPEIPIIVVTGGTELASTVELFKLGVKDYLLKPVNREELLHRVGACLEETRLRRELARVEREKNLIELEGKRLVNWRMLYAYKDLNQTGRLINLLTRTINSSGGFAWLDLVKSIPRDDNGGVAIERDILDLVLETAEAHRKILEFLGFIDRLPRMELDLEIIKAADLVGMIGVESATRLEGLCGRDRKSLRVSAQSQYPDRGIAVDRRLFLGVLRELVINAVKYSPPFAKIYLDITRGRAGSLSGSGAGEGADSLLITLRNSPKPLQARGGDGRPVIGVPYEYSELVFDLFFMIENFPTPHPEEEWPEGTGLYVARKLLARMGAAIAVRESVDYSADPPEPQVNFVMALPFRD